MESGPDETRTRDLRHARAARRFAGVFRCVQNACKLAHFHIDAFHDSPGYLLGLLHGCCTSLRTLSFLALIVNPLLTCVGTVLLIFTGSVFAPSSPSHHPIFGKLWWLKCDDMHATWPYATAGAASLNHEPHHL